MCLAVAGYVTSMLTRPCGGGTVALNCKVYGVRDLVRRALDYDWIAYQPLLYILARVQQCSSTALGSALTTGQKAGTCGSFKLW